MQRAFLGISHTPLMGLNSIALDVERSLQRAISQAREQVLAFDPELVVLAAPDHYNGFFNELMPPFCIGTGAYSVGDYLSPAGHLNVDSDAALRLVDFLMDNDFDPAVSRRMKVDHGFAQPLQMLWGGLETPPVLPIFLNAAAPPNIARIRRCRALGKLMGRFIDVEPRRTLLIGSGGLSHDPPVPTLRHSDPIVLERITQKHEPTNAEREAKTQRVMSAGIALAAGTSLRKPINPVWDLHWMAAMAGRASDLDALSRDITEDSIEQEAGLSANESKT